MLKENQFFSVCLEGFDYNDELQKIGLEKALEEFRKQGWGIREEDFYRVIFKKYKFKRIHLFHSSSH